MWRLMFLAQTSEVYVLGDKKIKNRSSTVPVTLFKRDTIIYTGKKWVSRRVNQWMIGFKFGEFTWNRKYALYKAKQKKKEKKKKKKINAFWAHTSNLLNKGFFFWRSTILFWSNNEWIISKYPRFRSKNEKNIQKAIRNDLLFKNNYYEKLDFHQNEKSKPLLQPINTLLSQINSVNNKLPDVHRLKIIRLYLIKTYRGRCHALGKPVNGQRTWSNGWNSYNLNKTLRVFISETKYQLAKNKKEEKINWKMTKKKIWNKK